MSRTAMDVVGGDRSVVVARINGELKDLSTPVLDTDVVEPVSVDSPEGLAVLRHLNEHNGASARQLSHLAGINEVITRRLLDTLLLEDYVYKVGAAAVIGFGRKSQPFPAGSATISGSMRSPNRP